MELIELKQELENEDNFVTTLIDTIPPKAYFNQDVQEYLEEQKCSVTDTTLKASKIESKMTAKGKQKRARLDPAQNQTVSQIMQQLAGKKKQKKNLIQNGTEESSNITELQARLRAKIMQLQSGRKIGQEDQQSKRLQRKLAKMKKKNKNKKITNGASLGGAVVEKMPKIPKVSKPVYNKDGNIVYSKFDLCENGAEKHNNGKKRLKSNDKLNSSRNLKRVLDKVKKEEQTLKVLNVENPDKANLIEQKKMWKKAIDKIEGVKVKDDPELLKKSIKKREKLKKKSQSKWAERTQHVDKLKQQRQDKRKSNIQDRRSKKIDKKINRAKKKGRILPGF